MTKNAATVIAEKTTVPVPSRRPARTAYANAAVDPSSTPG